MQIDIIFRIAAVGIIVAVLDLVLKRAGREDQAMMTSLAGIIVVLAMVVTQIDDLFESIRRTFGL